MIAPDKHGRGCVRGTHEEIQRAMQRNAAWDAFKQCRKSIAPWLVPRMFWIGTPFLIAQGALIISAAYQHPAGTNLSAAWAGLSLLLLGPVALRIACELANTHFEIQTRLEEMADRDE